MIVFYPRDIGMWRGEFNFTPDITLTPKAKTDHKVFSSRGELIEFLKQHGVRLDEPEHPLLFLEADEDVYKKGLFYQGELFAVVQRSVIGWIRDDYI